MLDQLLTDESAPLRTRVAARMRRKVTELAGNVCVKVGAMPSTVVVTGTTGCDVAVLGRKHVSWHSPWWDLLS